MNISTDRMHNNIMADNGGIEVSGPIRLTFWMFDVAAATRVYGEVRGYSGGTGLPDGGTAASGSLAQLFAAGKNNAVSPPEVFNGTKYQGRASFATNPATPIFFNLNGAGSPNRSPGWHKFDIERLSDGTTINYYVDGILSRTITGTVPQSLDTLVIGGPGLGTTAGDAWIDGIGLVKVVPDLTLTCPSNVIIVSPSGANVTYSAPTTSGGCLPVTVNCNPPSGSFFPVGNNPVMCIATDGCGQTNKCTFRVIVRTGDPCAEPDNGTGTVSLPPAGCQYLSPDQVHRIVDGLPPGTTIELAPIHKDFICSERGGSVCSFPASLANACREPGGTLGGEKECNDSTLQLRLRGTGMLAGFNRIIDFPVGFETHVGPRTPGQPVQTFDTDMFRLFGQITGDPDFDLLRITAGTDFGLPSPGHTTLTRRPDGNWEVDSFFDITYRIDFVGSPGGPLAGHSGSTTATIRMVATPTPGPLAITCPSNEIAMATAAGGGANVTYPPPTVTGGCPPVNVACNPPSGSFFPIGNNAVTCVATDACGNSQTCTFRVIVRTGDPCLEPDFTGTVQLPPPGCQYLSPQQVHMIIDGLPPGTTIELAAIHRDFICRQGMPSCLTDCFVTDDCDPTNGSTEAFDSRLQLHLRGTGMLAGWERDIMIPNVFCQAQAGPRFPGQPVQDFDTDMMAIQGQITGDPDFDLLRITGGSGFGMPSPGHTTLTLQPGGNWAVDSFFDITYRIDFVGAPGGALAGRSGSTTATIRMAAAPGVSPLGLACPANVTVVAAGGTAVTYPAPAVSGGCAPVNVACNPPSGSFFPVGNNPVTCVATDNCGNTTNCTFRVIVRAGDPCLEPDFTGTVQLPPPGCQYLSPQEVHMIIDGLPPGTTIELAAIHKDFICRESPCPADCFVTDDCDPTNGSTEEFNSKLQLSLRGTGMLAGWQRNITIPNVICQAGAGPRFPGQTVQDFDTDMMGIQGQITGDPDFDLLRITGGTGFGMPSPGHTTLTLQPGGNWAVDSFFDITYRIDFIGAPGGALAGRSGSTTATIRMGAVPATNNPPIALACPPDTTVLATGPAGAVVNYPLPTPGGGCPPVNVNCTPPSGSTFPIGTTTATCTASDACGQTAQCQFKVTVRRAPKPWWFPTPVLPPPQGEYISPQQWHQFYANGIIISNASHKRFLQSTPPPPPGGPPQTHTFGSTVQLMVSMDGGATFTPMTANANATVQVMPSTSPVGGPQTYDTEMLALDIVGPGIMIRESPTLASTGQTTVEQAAGGGNLIGSFFDITTEVSLDGGATWSPAQEPAPVELRVDPTTIPPVPAPTPLLPPPNDLYISPALYHLLLQNGIVIRDVRHRFFTQSQPPPPPGGPPQFHVFGSELDMQLSTDGGMTFRPVRAPAMTGVEVTPRSSYEGTFVYDTEMMELNAQGGDLPPGLMIRESPTLRSQGGTAVIPQADGTARIGSFFDISVEVTQDGGATWEPAPQPVRVELICPAPEVPEPSPNLPPLGDEYVSPAEWHAAFAQGIIISNVIHDRFTQSTPPPPPGGQQVHEFDSRLRFLFSQDGGNTWSPLTASAQVSVLVRGSQDMGDTRYFETEMLQLDITGGSLPVGVRLRESPTRASLGRTSIRMVTDQGNAIWDYISSSFAIFVELSTDGGATWQPSTTGPADVVLRDVPSTPITLTCPPDATTSTRVPSGAVVTYPAPTASGGCPPVNVVCNPPSGSTFPVGTTTVNCTATDSCGQTATCAFKVTVVRERPRPRWFPEPGLPPLQGEYISPQRWHQLYANGIIISNASHKRFLQNMPPPPPGGSQTHTFGSTVEVLASSDGGATWTPVVGTANVTVQVTHAGTDADGTQVYDTEMLQLDVVSPVGMIRESPTLQSTGQTTVQPAPGGGFMIGSFFDVNTELSLDGGASWSPANEPATVELVTDPTTIPPIVTPTPVLPPPVDLYISPRLYHILTAQGIVIRDVRHKFFTQGTRPPPPGTTATHTFDSQVDMDVSMDGGMTFRSMRAPAMVTVSLTHRSTTGDGTQVYDTEMLQLDLQGGDLPNNIRLRESPSRRSEGGTAISMNADGTARIGSFFDVFPEVSADGGATWEPVPEPARVELICEVPPHPFPSPNLPPPQGEYISPQRWHALYQQGIIISNVAHKRFLESFPPPPPGVTETHTFGSQVDADVSMDNGQSFQRMSMPAQVTVSIREMQSDGDTRYFETEMLQLDIQGATLPIRLRESPTKASLGRTSIRMVNDPGSGIWDYIQSFFDVFTELSTDGGATWSPSLTAPGTMVLQPQRCALSITCPPDVTVGTRTPTRVVTYAAPTVAGDCPPFTVVCNPPSGSAFPVGTTTVTCTVTDGQGNSASCSFKVTVVRLAPKPWWFPQPVLPPPQGEYISPQRWHQLYANGIIISNVSHRRFTQSQPPPPAGGTQTHTFGSDVEAQVSTDGGQTWTSVAGQADVTVRVTHTGTDADGTQNYDTEMLNLSLNWPGGIMLRESPSKASLGRTTVQQAPGGGAMIGSFFDVFTELSVDGGANWSPAEEPATVDLSTDPRTIPPIAAPTPILPPPVDLYISPALYHILTAQGIVIRDVRHKFFTQGTRPPPPGTTATHTFDSQVDMDVSMDGGMTFRPMRAPAMVTVSLTHRSTTPDGTQVYDTEMLALDLQGGDLSNNLRLRESPTRQSAGGTALRLNADGTTEISSFFDVFTELSVDGGQAWEPVPAPARVELICEAPPHPFPSPNLPPPQGEYISPQRWHALYQQGIIISNVAHKRFLESFPPPPPGVTETHTFGSQVDADVSLNNGQTWQRMSMPAQVTVSIRELQSDGDTRYFETEMLQLDIQGATLPIRLRESPSKASLGRTSMRMVSDPAGEIWDYIQSFFDVFTELSTDGGATWSPSLTAPGNMVLRPAESPCAGPARMQISRDDNGITISWTGDGFRLQCTDELQPGCPPGLICDPPPPPTVWTDVPGTSPVTLPTSGKKRFYRLICP